MIGWPYLAESGCPWCERVIDRPRLLRLHDEGAEFECAYCTGRHTRKEGIEDEVFIFFPGDIHAMVDATIKPLFPDPWWLRWWRAVRAALAAARAWLARVLRWRFGGRGSAPAGRC